MTDRNHNPNADAERLEAYRSDEPCESCGARMIDLMRMNDVERTATHKDTFCPVCQGWTGEIKES